METTAEDGVMFGVTESTVLTTAPVGVTTSEVVSVRL